MREDIKLYGKLGQRKAGPVAGQIEVCSSCFQKCQNCVSWREAESGKVQGSWSLDHFKALCTQLAQYPTFEHLTLTGGDPQAWKELPGAIAWLLERAEHAFKLQISTALMKMPESASAWRHVFNDVRVSLDAVSREGYKTARGVDIRPEIILDRIADLAHPSTAIITTVYPETINEMFTIAEEVSHLHKNCTPIRRHIFLPVLGTGTHDSEFWLDWHNQAEAIEARCSVPTSFGETLKAEDIDPSIPCRVGSLGFHLKSNGDYYTCCLAGGEALETSTQLRVDNFFEHPFIKSLYEQANRRVQGFFYHKDCSFTCKQICQRKQYDINCAIEKAEATSLAIP